MTLSCLIAVAFFRRKESSPSSWLPSSFPPFAASSSLSSRKCWMLFRLAVHRRKRFSTDMRIWPKYKECFESSRVASSTVCSSACRCFWISSKSLESSATRLFISSVRISCFLRYSPKSFLNSSMLFSDCVCTSMSCWLALSRVSYRVTRSWISLYSSPVSLTRSKNSSYFMFLDTSSSSSVQVCLLCSSCRSRSKISSSFCLICNASSDALFSARRLLASLSCKNLLNFTSWCCN
mmetsp:Transcript_49584/g.150945  ORF Transcript_49584/g.150945 Transcript_49584/m.150945 type:complete len:236 (-) Transcript_49584:185-892(-)